MKNETARWRYCRDEQCRSKQRCDAAPFPCSAEMPHDQAARVICIGSARKAFEETLRRYPNTDPGALIFFSGASGLCEAPLTDEDFEWGRKVKAEWETANGR